MTTMIAPVSEALTLSEIVASNIRAEAARRMLNQIQLGELIGMSQGAINKRWTGKRPWHLDDIEAVADVLGVSVADLVTPHGDGDGRPTGTRTRNPRIRGLIRKWVLVA